MAGPRVSRLAHRTAGTLVRAASGALRYEGRTYQPLPGTDSARQTEQRWELVRDELARQEVGSVLEVGCAEGWFVRRAATELKCFALGVEQKKVRVLKGELRRLSDGTGRVAIIRAKLSPDVVRRLPHCDVSLCLSVLHHVINRNGMEGGRDFLAALASVTRKALIFETGAPRLPEFRTRDGQGTPLSADEQDPHIRGLLKAAGLTEIRELGRTPGYEGKYTRALYVAVPEQVAESPLRQDAERA